MRIEFNMQVRCQSVVLNQPHLLERRRCGSRFETVGGVSDLVYLKCTPSL